MAVSDFDEQQTEIDRHIQRFYEARRRGRILPLVLFAGLAVVGAICAGLTLRLSLPDHVGTPLDQSALGLLSNFAIEMIGAAVIFLVIEVYWHRREVEVEEMAKRLEASVKQMFDQKVQELKKPLADAQAKITKNIDQQVRASAEFLAGVETKIAESADKDQPRASDDLTTDD